MSVKFELSPLPYAKDALAPYLSARTLELHYEKHHRGRLHELEKAIDGRPEADESLEEIVFTAEGAVFDLAVRVWNHDFYWRSMKPGGGGAPKGALRRCLETDFGSVAGFKRCFAEAAQSALRRGWVWLVLCDGWLAVRSTHEADTPLAHGETPLLACDVCEHAYSPDYGKDGTRYVEAFLDQLLDWDFAARQVAAGARPAPPVLSVPPSARIAS